MKTITLIYEQTGDEYRVVIPLSSYSPGQLVVSPEFTGTDYEDYFEDCINDLYGYLDSPDFPFRTNMFKSIGNNPTFDQEIDNLHGNEWIKIFWDDVGKSYRYANHYIWERDNNGVLEPGYDSTSGVVYAGVVGSSFSVGWYYLKGADPQTRRYLYWDGLNLRVYENDKTTTTTGWGGAEEVHLYNGTYGDINYGFYIGGTWDDFINGTLEDARAMMYTIRFRLKWHSKQQDEHDWWHYKMVWDWTLSPNSGILESIWQLYQAGDPDDPEDDPDPSDDPYNPYDPSGPSGPTPPHSPYDPGDPIPLPPTPGYNPSSTGMMKVYVPTDAQVQSLATRLWDNTFWTVIQNFISDPRDVIISLGAVPFSVVPSGYKEIYAGSIGTGVDSYYINNPYIDIDCGSVYIPAILGGYTDFSPYTQVNLTLPYVGSIQLDTDIFMAQYLQVKYRVDLITGNCIAYVLVNNNVKAQYNGNMKFTIPLTSADYAQVYGTFIGTATGAVLGAAGAAAAGAEAGAVDIGIGAVKGGVGKLSQTAGIKPNIQISGDLTSNNGLLGVQKPFIEIKRPNLCIPEGQKAIEGYPALFSGTLGSFVGYTEVEEIHLSIAGATQEELEEIEARLKTGVIL